MACAVRDERHDPLSVALWCWVTGPGNEGGDGVATECPPTRAGPAAEKAAATITSLPLRMIPIVLVLAWLLTAGYTLAALSRASAVWRARTAPVQAEAQPKPMA